MSVVASQMLSGIPKTITFITWKIKLKSIFMNIVQVCLFQGRLYKPSHYHTCIYKLYMVHSFRFLYELGITK